eukprot:scaffold77538_cov23-Tisochrysis_lutea.AAC.1
MTCDSPSDQRCRDAARLRWRLYSSASQSVARCAALDVQRSALVASLEPVASDPGLGAGGAPDPHGSRAPFAT